MPSVWGHGVNPSLGLSGAAELPRAPLQTAGTSESFAEHGGGSGLGDSLASSFPSKCFKRQRLEIKKELLCGGILRRLCKFLHLRAVCLFLLSLDSPKQLVASRGGELSHACNALAPKGCLGNISLCLEGVNRSTEQETSIAVNPEAMPWVPGLVTQTRRTTCWGQMSKRQPQQGRCSSARVRGDLWSGDGLTGWQRPSGGRSPSGSGLFARSEVGVPGLGSCGTHLDFRDSWLERATVLMRGHPTEKLSRFCSCEGWCLGKKDA